MNTFTSGQRVRVKDNYPITNDNPDKSDIAERGNVYEVSHFKEPYYNLQPVGSEPMNIGWLFFPEELEAV